MTNQHQQQTQIRPTVHNQPFAIQPPQITGMIQSVFIRQNASSVKVSHQIANRRKCPALPIFRWLNKIHP
jgi:hypothetical protein